MARPIMFGLARDEFLNKGNVIPWNLCERYTRVTSKSLFYELSRTLAEFLIKHLVTFATLADIPIEYNTYNNI